MAGLYETALDALCAPRDRRDGGPAQDRRLDRDRAAGEDQIRALFGRPHGRDLPAAGPGPPRLVLRPDAVPPSESHARLYLGVAAQGRSPKVVLLRAYLALLAPPQKRLRGRRRHKNADNPADPYMTLLGYFNSLRELGGSRRIIEDEVRTRSTGYGDAQARRRGRRARSPTARSATRRSS